MKYLVMTLITVAISNNVIANVESIDFNSYTIDSFNSTQDVTNTYSIQDGGSTLRLTGNTWKKIDFPYTVTANTVIEFDFASNQQGEVHGIGFETDDVISADLTFKLYGTQDWGLSDFDSYDVAPGVKHYVIPVGLFYTGSFDRLFFAMDDDASASGESVFSNVNVYDVESIDFNSYNIDSFSPTQDVTGTYSVEDGGSTLRLTGNTWKKIDFPYTVTANTVIEFDFASSQQGEVHGIGFETDDAISADLTFKLYGTQDWGLSDFDSYDVAPGVKHYVIPVGLFYTGTFDRLFFAMDDDASASGESVFANVRVYEEAIDFMSHSIDSFSPTQDVTGTYSVEDGGSTLHLTENTWKKIDFPYTVTANTVIEFDFASSQQGEVHGIGFETDDVISADLTFKLYGTQDWGLLDFDSYDVAPGFKHYVIPVGTFYTGTFDRLVFAMDDDASASGESVFSNVRVYEQEIAVTITDEIDVYFIGNSLSWDALNNGAMEDLFQKGGVELNANYHIRCSSSLASTYNNSTDPCVVSGDGAWDTALVSNSYDYLVLQPHEGGTTEEEIAAIDAFTSLNPSAYLIIYEAYPGFGPAGDLTGFYNQPDQSEFLQSHAEFLQIREAHPDALPVPAMEVLLAFDEMARDGGFVGINSVQDIYRDERHLNNIGKYLLALTFYSSLTGYDPSLTGLDLHARFEGVTSEQALAMQWLVSEYFTLFQSPQQLGYSVQGVR